MVEVEKKLGGRLRVLGDAGGPAVGGRDRLVKAPLKAAKVAPRPPGTGRPSCGQAGLLGSSVGEEGWFIAAEPPIDRHERRLWLEHRLAAPWTLVLVAVAVDEVIGYLTAVGSDREPAEISLGVAQEWRGHGVGTRLVKAAIRWGRDHHVHKLAVEVFPHNQPTLHLFETLDFQREGLRRAHYRRRSGALWDVTVMGLPLQPDPSITRPPRPA